MSIALAPRHLRSAEVGHLFRKASQSAHSIREFSLNYRLEGDGGDNGCMACQSFIFISYHLILVSLLNIFLTDTRAEELPAFRGRCPVSYLDHLKRKFITH